MTQFAISVPVGAWHPLLPACLESLRQQNVDLQVAILDASEDPRVFEVAEKHDHWLSYRHHGPDSGQSDAILKGWAAVEGDWLGWLNADDTLMPEALSRVSSKIAHEPELEIVYGHSNIVDDAGRFTGYHFNVEPPSERLLQSGIISQPSCFFSRTAYDRAGGLDQDRHYTMDWDLWIRMFKSGARFGFIDEVLSTVLWGAATKTASFNAARRAELKSLISEHSPASEHRAVFRAFAIHTLADLVRPDPLKRRVIRRLRRSGPRIFGLRADGQIDQGAELHLTHYDAVPNTGLCLEFARSIGDIEIESNPSSSILTKNGRHVQIRFDQPQAGGALVTVRVSAPAKQPVLLEHVQWTG